MYEENPAVDGAAAPAAAAPEVTVAKPNAGEMTMAQEMQGYKRTQSAGIFVPRTKEECLSMRACCFHFAWIAAVLTVGYISQPSDAGAGCGGMTGVSCCDGYTKGAAGFPAYCADHFTTCGPAQLTQLSSRPY